MRVKDAIAVLSECDENAVVLAFDIETERMKPITGLADNGTTIEVVTSDPEEEVG